MKKAFVKSNNDNNGNQKNIIIIVKAYLKHVFEQKDLGVILDAGLKLDEHISVKMKKANAMVELY